MKISILKNAIFISAFGLILFAQNVRAQNNDELPLHERKASEKIHLKWTEVENALGYFVQIKDGSDKIIFEKRVDSNSIELKFSPGKYFHRVGVINKFYKVSSFTEWSTLNVVQGKQPNVKELVQGKTDSESGKKPVEIKGSDFQEGAMVRAKSRDTGATVDIKPESISNNALTLNLGTELPPGKYDIEVINPGGKKDTLSRGLGVKKSEFKKREKIEEKLAQNNPLDDSKDKVAVLDKPQDSKKPVKKSGGFAWEKLIIGVPRYQSNDPWVASAQLAAFGGLLGGAGAEAAAANGIATGTASSLYYKFYNDYLMYDFLKTSGAIGQEELFKLGIKNYFDMKTSQQKYRWHLHNAAGFAGGAALIYGIHLLDAYHVFGFDMTFGLTAASNVDPNPVRPVYSASRSTGFQNAADLQLKISFPLN